MVRNEHDLDRNETIRNTIRRKKRNKTSVIAVDVPVASFLMMGLIMNSTLRAVWSPSVLHRPRFIVKRVRQPPTRAELLGQNFGLDDADVNDDANLQSSLNSCFRAQRRPYMSGLSFSCLRSISRSCSIKAIDQSPLQSGGSAKIFL